MPKKTKKQKILAEKRRHVSHQTSSHPMISSAPTTSTSPSVFSFQASAHKPSNNSNDQGSTELSVIRHDLFKTIMLAIAAISIELVLYWKYV
jgi:hypothetical protein